MRAEIVDRIEIIAEAANAHEGSPERMRLLVALAARAGADAVKFQLIFAEELCTADHNLFPVFRGRECSPGDWERAAILARELNCAFHVDIFGERSLEVAEHIRADAVKLHATDVGNHRLLERVARCGVTRVLIGIGGSNEHEIDAAVARLPDKDVTLIHGFQGYPTVVDANQVRRIHWLRERFPSTRVGFADHVPYDSPERTWLSAVAIGAGADLLEKHLTVASVLAGSDHEAALDADAFADFCQNMALAHRAFGPVIATGGDLGMSADELSYRQLVRKDLVAAVDLPEGRRLEPGDLTLKRSGHAQAQPLDPTAVIGRRLRQPVVADGPIYLELLADQP